MKILKSQKTQELAGTPFWIGYKENAMNRSWSYTHTHIYICILLPPLSVKKWYTHEAKPDAQECFDCEPKSAQTDVKGTKYCSNWPLDDERKFS